MAGIGAVNVDLAGIGTAVKDIGSGVTDFWANIQGKLSPDQAEKAQEFKSNLDAAVNAAQAAINAAEAVSANFFVSGWRPFVGWVCGLAFSLNFLIFPIAQAFISGFGSLYKLPQLDMGALMAVMIPMLGLIGGRSWEKVNNAQDRH
jgi:hypothetical protein